MPAVRRVLSVGLRSSVRAERRISFGQFASSLYDNISSSFRWATCGALRPSPILYRPLPSVVARSFMVNRRRRREDTVCETVRDSEVGTSDTASPPLPFVRPVALSATDRPTAIAAQRSGLGANELARKKGGDAAVLAATPTYSLSLCVRARTGRVCSRAAARRASLSRRTFAADPYVSSPVVVSLLSYRLTLSFCPHPVRDSQLRDAVDRRQLMQFVRRTAFARALWWDDGGGGGGCGRVRLRACLQGDCR